MSKKESKSFHIHTAFYMLNHPKMQVDHPIAIKDIEDECVTACINDGVGKKDFNYDCATSFAADLMCNKIKPAWTRRAGSGKICLTPAGSQYRTRDKAEVVSILWKARSKFEQSRKEAKAEEKKNQAKAQSVSKARSDSKKSTPSGNEVGMSMIKISDFTFRELHTMIGGLPERCLDQKCHSLLAM